MCYHDEKDFGYASDLMSYYNLANFLDSTRAKLDEAQQVRFYHNNGFDHNLLPVITLNDCDQFDIGLMQWGLIPHWTKSSSDAKIKRIQNLNCISEEMFEKPTFKPSLEKAQRCLIPSSGFYEWQWQDKAGKNKQPYYIHLKEQKIFSFAGIWAKWVNPEDQQEVFTFSKLTVAANPLMERIHNNKKRMPVIIPRELEKEWVNPNLTKDQVLAMCVPYDENKMEAWPISKLITSKTQSSNVPEVKREVETGLLF